MQAEKIISLSEKQSIRLLEDGKHQISVGDLDVALQSFQKSLQFKPTAEAYTYLGWVLSLKDELEEAIELCFKAIRLDPLYGNPYNDVGSYLIKRGQFNEAIPWLQKAKLAENYETRHFPFINLGRIFAAQGRIDEAIKEFNQALELSPEHELIQNVLTELHALKSREESKV
jgi:Tfp pilus assembly protein PilF